MKNLTYILFLLLIQLSGIRYPVSGQQTVRQGHPVPDNYCISSREIKLYNMINEYRRKYDLPPVPLSRSLSFVASTHVKDLSLNHPDIEPCNSHSWSDQGTWKPFCYPRDEKKGQSVWDKPKEMTTYKGKGFEIIYWENNPVNIDSIIPFWKSISYFNSFLMNTGKWQDKKWNAIGIGIYENYASAWFGELADPEGEPVVCGKVKEKPAREVPVAEHKDTIKAAAHPDKKKKPPPLPGKTGEKRISAPDTGSTLVSRQFHLKYYIIVSSQQPREKSKAFATELIRRGYPDAKVLVNGKNVRVSVFGFDDKSVADRRAALREVKKTFKDAWILR